MINVSILDEYSLIAFWLFFTRCITILIQLPIFQEGKVPVLIRVLGSLVFAYAFFPMVESSVRNEVIHYGVDNFWILTIGNAVIGLVIGLLIKSIIGIFMSVGNLMSQQIGFAQVSYFDPTFNTQGGPFETIIVWVLTILILKTGALLPIFKGIIASTFNINMLNLERLFQSPQFYIEFFKSLVVVSFLLTGPILFSNLILNLLMGIIAKLVPQLNVLMVSFVVNIGVGLFVFFIVQEEFFLSVYRFYIQKLGDWFQFVSY